MGVRRALFAVSCTLLGGCIVAPSAVRAPASEVFAHIQGAHTGGVVTASPDGGGKIAWGRTFQYEANHVEHVGNVQGADRNGDTVVSDGIKTGGCEDYYEVKAVRDDWCPDCATVWKFSCYNQLVDFFRSADDAGDEDAWLRARFARQNLHGSIGTTGALVSYDYVTSLWSSSTWKRDNLYEGTNRASVDLVLYFAHDWGIVTMDLLQVSRRDAGTFAGNTWRPVPWVAGGVSLLGDNALLTKHSPLRFSVAAGIGYLQDEADLVVKHYPWSGEFIDSPEPQEFTGLRVGAEAHLSLHPIPGYNLALAGSARVAYLGDLDRHSENPQRTFAFNDFHESGDGWEYDVRAWLHLPLWGVVLDGGLEIVERDYSFPTLTGRNVTWSPFVTLGSGF